MTLMVERPVEVRSEQPSPDPAPAAPAPEAPPAPAGSPPEQPASQPEGDAAPGATSEGAIDWKARYAALEAERIPTLMSERDRARNALVASEENNRTLRSEIGAIVEDIYGWVDALAAKGFSAQQVRAAIAQEKEKRRTQAVTQAANGAEALEVINETYRSGDAGFAGYLEEMRPHATITKASLPQLKAAYDKVKGATAPAAAAPAPAAPAAAPAAPAPAATAPAPAKAAPPAPAASPTNNQGGGAVWREGISSKELFKQAGSKGQ